MRENARVARMASRDQHAVRHLGTIIEDRLAPERGHFTIRLIHDLICRGEIPIVALAAGKRRVDSAVRHAA